MMAAPNWASPVGKPPITVAGNGIIDAEFETITRHAADSIAAPAKPDKTTESPPNSDHLSLLRSESPAERAASHPDNLTPTFMLFTLLAAFVVFWVSGGHVLLY